MSAIPFRSYRLSERRDAADKLIRQRKKELATLEKRWRGEKIAKRQRLLMTRMQATRNHIVSWQNYIADGCPRVANATTRV
ncbi:hypothetical protein PV336_16210 [Streptomyces sp. MI02-2A]|uniref:hypothetical protein n=1 Tax=Streptomyces sp. MI02-2A TaxID=3028688 RepID=UPI0029A201F9|nr:hypothetical protein [Streptomyces sp. MI02-2A]MDX3260765.1 hypothetical protein [Streptomyces sp. MI02-2A]